MIESERTLGKKDKMKKTIHHDATSSSLFNDGGTSNEQVFEHKLISSHRCCSSDSCGPHYYNCYDSTTNSSSSSTSSRGSLQPNMDLTEITTRTTAIERRDSEDCTHDDVHTSEFNSFLLVREDSSNESPSSWFADTIHHTILLQQPEERSSIACMTDDRHDHNSILHEHLEALPMNLAEVSMNGNVETNSQPQHSSLPEKEPKLFFSNAQQLEEYVLEQIGRMDESIFSPSGSLEKENFELNDTLGERVDKALTDDENQPSQDVPDSDRPCRGDDPYLVQETLLSEKLSTLQDENYLRSLQLGSLLVGNEENHTNYQMETIDNHSKNEIINNNTNCDEFEEKTSVACSYEETTSAESSSVDTELSEDKHNYLKTEQKIEPTLVDDVEHQHENTLQNLETEYALSPQPQHVNIPSIPFSNSPTVKVTTSLCEKKRKLEALKTTTSLESCNIMTIESSSAPSPTDIQFAVIEIAQVSLDIKGTSFFSNGIYYMKQKYRKSDKVLICLIITCLLVSCILFTAPIPLLAIGSSFLQQSGTPTSAAVSDGNAIIYTRFPCYIVGTRECSYSQSSSYSDTNRGIVFRISFPTFSKDGGSNVSQTNPNKPYKTLLSDTCYPKSQQYHTQSEYVCYTNKDETKVSLTEPKTSQSSYMTNVGFQLLLFGIIGFISSVCIVISLCCICWILIEHKPWIQDNLTFSEQLQLEAAEEASRKYKEANLV